MEDIMNPNDPILCDYTFEDFERMVFSSVVDAVCTECYEIVGRLEPDAREVDWNCPCCDAAGKHVKSILVYAGLC